ncbi:glycosyltransferase family 2 protein [uncultured Agrobacterium sp.]|uniref:glycosyltransferase family 2 protein n=1 Tax=uncultured Agrobacterium sp. TaxID=157277 RepID=UPI0025EDBEB5|nr:glycosyltransferase family 2 protein [uncultured Agrobacterium sp.]
MSKLTSQEVTIVTVCYKSGDVISDMINSIPIEVPIVLVDNGCAESFPDFKERRHVTIVRLSENMGFGRGCNAGAAVASTPWIFFLNPDARLKTGAIDALLDAAARLPSATAFNPKILNSDGTQYFKRRSWLLPRRNRLPKGWPQTDTIVPVLSGAALFVSKEKFDLVGGFDPNIFLYHEDDDLSLRLAAFGPLYFVRGATVEHAGGHSSTRSASVSRLKAFHMAQSRVYTGRKHKRRFAKLSTLMQGTLLLISPLNIFYARRRAKAIGFIGGAIISLLRKY